MNRVFAHIILIAAIYAHIESNGQCTNYNITVSLGSWPSEVSWSLVNSGGTIVASGLAGANQVVCLPNGCYTFNMFDSYGDGWNGASFTITAPGPVVVASGTLSSGYFGSQSVTLGNVNCCPAGTASYNISLTGGAWPAQVSWQLRNASGTLIVSGGAPYNSSVCLAPGCYRFFLYDSFGDGWNGATYTISQGASVIATGTLTSGSSDIDFISIGGVSCMPNCAPGQSLYLFSVTGGVFPGEISWILLDNNNSVVGSGGAPNAMYFCGGNVCFTLQMFDSFGDGWNGAEYSVTDALGTVIQSGTLNNGTTGSTPIELGTADCGVPDPITASDCINAVDICENFSFAIDPNGSGLINEIPPLGSIGNPDYIVDGINSPWGSDNYGCLRANELNSTWMIINIWVGGVLNFTFGGMGTQAGYYDWIMYPYDSLNGCQNIYNNVLPPVRCNWNMVPYGGTGLQSVIPPGGNAGNYEPPLNVLAGEQYIICFSNYSSATTVVPLDFGGTAVVGCYPLMLPVTWLSFSVMEKNGSCELKWSTAAETNNDFFEVQHLKNDIWEQIAVIDGNGTVQQISNYSFLHKNPSPGMNYYRIRQVDFNGQAFLSEVQSVMMHSTSNVVSPNPNKGLFYFPGANDQFAIYNSYGQLVPFEIYQNQIQLMNAISGVYLLVDIRSGEQWKFTVE